MWMYSDTAAGCTWVRRNAAHHPPCQHAPRQRHACHQHASPLAGPLSLNSPTTVLTHLCHVCHGCQVLRDVCWAAPAVVVTPPHAVVVLTIVVRQVQHAGACCSRVGVIGRVGDEREEGMHR